MAYSGKTSAPLWHNGFSGHPVIYIESAGRTDGDGTDDLLYTGIDWEAWDHFIASTLASGADGEVRWKKMTDGAGPIGDINGDGRADVLLLYALFTDKVVGIRYAALSASGKAAYDRTYGVVPPRGSMMVASIFLRNVGDVDDDGAVDFAHEVEAYGFSRSGAKSARERGVVLTGTGRKAFDGRAHEPLYGSVDGRGDDFVQLERADGVRVIVRNGRTNAEMWRRRVALKGYRFGYPIAADLTGDGRAEVLLLAYRKSGPTLLVLDGTTHALRWRR